MLAPAMDSSLFSLLDKDGSNEVKTSELRDTLVGMQAGLEEEDIEAAMKMFDHNRSGSITRKEFVQTIELLSTFD